VPGHGNQVVNPLWGGGEKGGKKQVLTGGKAHALFEARRVGPKVGEREQTKVGSTYKKGCTSDQLGVGPGRNFGK